METSFWQEIEPASQGCRCGDWQSGEPYHLFKVDGFPFLPFLNSFRFFTAVTDAFSPPCLWISFFVGRVVSSNVVQNHHRT